MVWNRTRTAGGPWDTRSIGRSAGGAEPAPADARPGGSNRSARRADIDSEQSARADAARGRGACTVIRRLAQRDIATRLFVSTKTVEHHVSAILAKLGVPSRAEAVAMARNPQDK